MHIFNGKFYRLTRYSGIKEQEVSLDWDLPHPGETPLGILGQEAFIGHRVFHRLF